MRLTCRPFCRRQQKGETMIEVKLLNEAGHEQALYGMSLSHGLHVKDMSEHDRDERKAEVALHLAHKQGGHNKFLESIIIWIDVRAPRYWWQQADTYRVGSTKQSESTMHTITRRPLEQRDFYDPIHDVILEHLNCGIANKDLNSVKRLLPESFMQRRVWCLSYKTVQNMYLQRKAHKLQEWRDFLFAVLDQIQEPDYIDER